MELADYSVLKKEVFDDVYEPSEDTFILIDALEKDLDLIKKLGPGICLEIGSGSGVVTTSLGKVLGYPYFLCTDINPIAASATKATSVSNGVPVDVITTDLVCVLEDRLKNAVDLLICNPPYAVTPSEEVGGSNTHKATSGGIKGREVIDRILSLVPKFLSKKGMFYLTCIAQNDVEDMSRCMRRYGLKMTKVLERRCGIERLIVLRFSYNDSVL
ncbi:HemK methyltransferase family member 2 [Araneus ventricosus]|uniref:Methyltransferase HEMK2 n=1 Tax=Araneus ventricosus TaxID=182803 RepID=A0A4Y2LH39_ARAVE|nr:HemK methyltransferase family member 2 [Araneus ventricosus]